MRITPSKLGFRNKTAVEQLVICRRVIASIAKASPEERGGTNLDQIKATVTAAAASQTRILQLQANLRAATRQRDKLLREARQKVTCANIGLIVGLKHKAERLQAVGMELRGKRLRSVGAPRKVTNLSVQPLLNASTVLLRYDRPLRDCSFLIEARLEGEPETA